MTSQTQNPAALGVKLTASRLREILEYDPKTGVFLWRRRQARDDQEPAKVASWNTRYAGGRAGVKTHGYVKISVDDHKHYAHRLAFLFMTGAWPPSDKVVDHIDRNGLNNAWLNLRTVSKRANSQNAAPAPNPTGLNGVTMLPSGRWMAQCTYLGRRLYLGVWETPEEAHAAYIRKQRQLPDHFQIEETSNEWANANA